MSAWRAHVARRAALLDEVRVLLLEVLVVDREPDELDPDAPLFGTGLGLDSIDALDLVVRLEARFGVEELVEEAGALEGARTLRTLNTIVDRLVAAGAEP